MERLIVNNIAVDAFSIVIFSFSKIFTEAIDKWNGVLSQVTGGGAMPLIGLGDTPTHKD